jgi:hypothetical protein
MQYLNEKTKRIDTSAAAAVVPAERQDSGFGDEKIRPDLQKRGRESRRKP